MSKKLLVLGASSIALLPALASATTTTSSADIAGEDVIVVTATPLAKPADEQTSTTVLTGEELQRQIRSTLGETLSREPGVSSTAYGQGASRPIIRGLDLDRVRTLTNGVGSIDAAAASPDHATPIEPALATQIEVVKGTALLRYGSSAAGGVVNVLDGRIPSEVPEDGITGSLRGAVTTVDSGAEVGGGASVYVGKLGGLDVVATGSASWREAEDYEIPGSAESAILEAFEEAEGEEHDEDEEESGDTLENSFVESQTFAGGLSFIADRGFFGFSVQNYESEYGLPGGHGHGHEEEEHEGEEEHEEEEEEGAFIDLEQTRVDVNGSLEVGGFIDRIDLFAGYADYEHIEFEAPGEPGTVFANEGYEIRVEALQSFADNWRSATGVQYRSREFSAIGEEAFVPPSETDQYGIFTFQEVTVGQATFEGSLRYERTEQFNTVTRDDLEFDGISVALGTAYRVNDNFLVTANGFRTERAPTSEELFADGPHLATDSFELGDTSIDIETALGVDLGFRLENDWGVLVVNAFYTDYEDFVYLRDLGITGGDILLARGEDDPEELEEFGELGAFQFTAAVATFQGFEIQDQADLGEVAGVAFTTDAVIDYVEAELSQADEAGNTNLPRIPPLGVTAGIDADYDKASLRFEVEYVGEADDTATFELPTDSYTLLNLYAEYEIAQDVVLSVAALNLSDEEARVHSSFVKDVAPLPGRNVRVALAYRF